jgi:hypothetical protein
MGSTLLSRGCIKQALRGVAHPLRHAALHIAGAMGEFNFIAAPQVLLHALTAYRQLQVPTAPQVLLGGPMFVSRS